MSKRSACSFPFVVFGDDGFPFKAKIRTILENNPAGQLWCGGYIYFGRKVLNICSLLWSVYAISSCQALGKVKTQKNPAIKDWIVGHNIVRIALYCKWINSHFPFSHHPSHKVLWMTGHTERKRSASYRNEMACRGVMK